MAMTARNTDEASSYYKAISSFYNPQRQVGKSSALNQVTARVTAAFVLGDPTHVIHD